MLQTVGNQVSKKQVCSKKILKKNNEKIKIFIFDFFFNLKKFCILTFFDNGDDGGSF